MIISYHRWPILALVLMQVMTCGALAYGSSVEDLVGVFSIEKNIQLGGSGSCYGSEGPCSMHSAPLDQSSIRPMDDDQAPSLAGIELDPSVLKPGSNAVNITLHAIDDQSGLGSSIAYFKSPSGSLTQVFFPQSSRTSGTPKDGIYSSRLVLPKSAESGTWMIENLTLMDAEGNSRVLQKEDMARLGQPSEFLVA